MNVTGRTAGRVAMLVALFAMLVGCVSLPDHSSVQSSQRVGTQASSSKIYYHPPGPHHGAPRPDIVDGYLAAMLAFPSDPALVRQFLTPAAAKAWQPTGRLQVYKKQRIDAAGKDVRLRARILGSLDVRGFWLSEARSSAAMDVRVTMTMIDGQWRIANPLQGTLIDTDTFSRYYRQYSLYYYDPSSTVLAPAPVYQVLDSPGRTATALVRDLLLGPPASMDGVVQSSAPEGTRLTPNVTVSDSGTAEIALSSNVARLPADKLRNLAGQLALTLRQGIGVNQLRLTAAGHALDVQSLGTTFSVNFFHSYSQNPAASRVLYALSDKGKLYTASSDGSHLVTGPIGEAPINARSVAVNASGFAALVNQGGTKVVVGGVTPAQAGSPHKAWITDGTHLRRPSWDAFGLLWVVDAKEHHATIELARKTGHTVVPAPGLTGRNVSAFAVSGDGMRYAAVIDGTKSQLVVGMIERNANKLTDVSLVGQRPIVNGDFALSNIGGLAWADATTVIVLASNKGSVSQPYEVAIDGSRALPTPGFLPEPPVSVTSGRGVGAPTVIGSAGGSVYVRTPDQNWALLDQKDKTKLFAPVYPG